MYLWDINPGIKSTVSVVLIRLAVIVLLSLCVPVYGFKFQIFVAYDFGKYALCYL